MEGNVSKNFIDLTNEQKKHIVNKVVPELCSKYCNRKNCQGCFIEELTAEYKKSVKIVNFNSQEELQSVVDLLCEATGATASFYGEDNDSLTWDFDSSLIMYLKNNRGNGLYLCADNVGTASYIIGGKGDCDDVESFISRATTLIRKSMIKERAFNDLCDDIDKDKITSNSNVTLTGDSVDGRKVACLDFVYDNSEDLPECIVDNILTMDDTRENRLWLKDAGEFIAERLNVYLYKA